MTPDELAALEGIQQELREAWPTATKVWLTGYKAGLARALGAVREAQISGVEIESALNKLIAREG